MVLSERSEFEYNGHSLGSFLQRVGGHSESSDLFRFAKFGIQSGLQRSVVGKVDFHEIKCKFNKENFVSSVNQSQKERPTDGVV